VHKGNKTV
jgi:hypothetical protein